MKLSTGKIIYLIVLLVVLFLCGKTILKDTKGMINEIKNEVVVLDEAVSKPENDGKLILVTSQYDLATIKDDIFNVEVKTPSLKRNVEMYQYDVEGDDTLTKEWSSTIDGEVLKDSQGIEMTDERGRVLRNPSTNLENETYTESGKVGEFIVDKDLFALVDAEEKIYAPENTDAVLYDGQKYYYVNGYYNTCQDEGREIIGDIRVKFTYKDMSNVNELTVLAKQEGSKLSFFETSDGTKVGEVVSGRTSLDSLLKGIEKSAKSGKTTAIVILIITLGIGVLVFRKKEAPSENKTEENK